MSKDASCKFVWGDGEYKFALPLEQVEELQEKCKVGPGTLLKRVLDGGWFVADIRETIRLGLIGGGKKPAEAYILVKRYVDAFPWSENLMPAALILSACVHGDSKDDDPPKGKAEAPETTATDASTLPSSTEPEPS